ncbi:RNA-directed DNA polymerase [Nodularia spumigena CS-591/12]|uniref:RNA-directed DNA polymerase n=1 Tax=Nodularia spumigena TaxID=70799 RepID=UPI002330B0D6|nr:RNA-directed DNA polymerase [Nodularia spumigena]MDB9303336.1 RNA-directed DNA polymerase [Nodularia spumigena CS-591/12]MDB9345396.1 RNA-directed DNA polymerase [Nodularia spumigena CS-588/06]MDB9371149.1 RNA-directed DNA polymerase [Nodularia spumigena CS-586/05]
MKRYGNLYPEIIKFENILLASRQAQKGKRFRDNVLEFNYNLETELIRLQKELTDKTYQPGAYRTFHLIDPKSRLISAAPYRDRVVHHALCNIIVPIFEKTFIADSYANRLGFGTHRALRKFTNFARNSRYVLQCDIRKYFPSIDHIILKELIRRKIKCSDTLWLIDTIIDNSNEQETVIDYFPGDDLLSPVIQRKGLPIGNLTSQFFSNIYLNGFDHFVKEQLKISKYVRYVDDFALFSDERQLLADARLAIEEYLTTLRLKIHPIKSQLFETQIGATFLGFRVFADRIRVRNSNLHHARRRLKGLQTDYLQGRIEQEKVNQSIQSWFAHLEHGDTWQLRQQIFTSLAWSRK